MAEKRTKADRLQRSIQRTEKRVGARGEEDFLEPKQDKLTAFPGPTGSQKEKKDEHEAA